MAQVINTNSLSLITQNNINKNQSALSTSIERLSSGLRINSAKDDAAGQAIANRFTSNINGLTQAARNANDGISLAQTTEGALSEINNNLQRIRELTVQSQNGTNSDSDLSSIQDEIKSRLDEIDRVSGQTQFNGVNVLSKNNTLSIQVGANDGQTIDINLNKIDSASLNLSGFNVEKKATITATEAQVSVTSTSYSSSATALKTGSADSSAITNTDGGALTISKVDFDESTGKYYATVADSVTTSEDASGVYIATVADDGSITLAGSTTTEPTGLSAVTNVQTATTTTSDVTADTTKAAKTLADAGVTGATEANTKLVKLTSTDSGGNVTDAGYGLQVGGANGKIYATNYDGTNGASLDAKTVSFTTSGSTAGNAAVELGGLNGKTEVATVNGKTYLASDVASHDFSDASSTINEVNTTTTADPLKALDAAIAQVDKFRSGLGAIQNRLDSAVTNLNNTTTNLSEAQSRIQDADYATEVSNMSKAQIIQQAGNSVLAKANQVPQQVLSLLQG